MTTPNSPDASSPTNTGDGSPSTPDGRTSRPADLPPDGSGPPGPGTPGNGIQTVMPPRVLVVDDHAAMRWALRELMETIAGMEVVGDLADGSEVEAAVRRTRPDVVVSDLVMPGPDGIEVTRRVRQTDPGVQVVVFTGAAARGSELHARARAAGAYEWVSKGELPDVLLTAVARACAAARRTRR